MRRACGIRAAVAGVFVGLLVTACSPDVVRRPIPVDGTGPVGSSVSDDGSLPSDQPAMCGIDQGRTRSDSLLTSQDVWPDAADAAQIASDMSLSTDACQSAVDAVPSPSPVACEVGFPWYPTVDLPVELARLGVTRVRNAELLRVRPDRSVSGRVSEYVLTLTGPASNSLEQTAIRCGAVRAIDNGAPIYATLDSARNIAVAVRIDYDQAVGLSFTGTDLSDAAKLALLSKAVELAAVGA